jgi:peptide/nickel transport system substrate-binding protein
MNIRVCVRMPRTGHASGRSSVIVESWGEAAMRRRDLLKAAVGASNLAMPKLGRAERPNKLVFAPTNDLAILDPVVTFARPTRNHGYLVYDTLYGIDADWRVRPQMVEGHRVADDGSTWTLTLREGLRFHDGAPVLARDAVASIHRFAQRISFVGSLMAATEELSAPDDRTVRFRLRRPFPHLPESVVRAGWQHARHYAGASGRGVTIQGGHRDCRQRSLPFPAC